MADDTDPNGRNDHKMSNTNDDKTNANGSNAIVGNASNDSKTNNSNSINMSNGSKTNISEVYNGKTANNINMSNGSKTNISKVCDDGNDENIENAANRINNSLTNDKSTVGMANNKSSQKNNKISYKAIKKCTVKVVDIMSSNAINNTQALKISHVTDDKVKNTSTSDVGSKTMPMSSVVHADHTYDGSKWHEEPPAKKRRRQTATCAVSICLSPLDASYFRFPRDPATRRAWLRACRRPEGDVKPEHARICSRHFREDQFLVDPYEKYVGDRLRCKRKALKPGSIPQLHLIAGNQERDEKAVKRQRERQERIERREFEAFKAEYIHKVLTGQIRDDISDEKSQKEKFLSKQVQTEKHPNPLVLEVARLKNTAAALRKEMREMKRKHVEKIREMRAKMKSLRAECKIRKRKNKKLAQNTAKMNNNNDSRENSAKKQKVKKKKTLTPSKQNFGNDKETSSASPALNGACRENSLRTSNGTARSLEMSSSTQSLNNNETSSANFTSNNAQETSSVSLKLNGATGSFNVKREQEEDSLLFMTKNPATPDSINLMPFLALSESLGLDPSSQDEYLILFDPDEV